MAFYLEKKGRPRKVDTKSMATLEFIATHPTCDDQQFESAISKLDSDLYKVALRIREIQRGREVYDSAITRTAKAILESVK